MVSRSGPLGSGFGSKEAVPRSCIFCGRRANSKEHAIPKWMAKRLGLRGRFLETKEVVGRVKPRKQHISIASHRSRIFCDGCQHHFKRLEDAVIPFLDPMASGKAVTLTVERQLLLATWGAKTAYALIACERGLEELAPRDHRLHLRERGEPATELYVGFAPWEGSNLIHVGDLQLQGSSVYPPEQLYGAILGIGKLVLKVVGITDTRLPAPVFSGERHTLKQVWPKLDRVIHWPPFGAFDDRHIDALAPFLPV
jgi:hypothetical protein